LQGRAKLFVQRWARPAKRAKDKAEKQKKKIDTKIKNGDFL